MKIVHHSKVHGHQIQAVYLIHQGWKKADLPYQTFPDESKTFNFKLEAGGQTWFVFDPYGNGDETFNGISPRLAKDVFGETFWSETVAYDTVTGKVLKAVVYKERSGYSLGFLPFVSSDTIRLDGSEDLTADYHVVPKRFRPKMAGLLSMKRPFSLGLPSMEVGAFFDRETSRSDLRNEIVIRLQWQDKTLELWRNMHRTYTPWA